MIPGVLGGPGLQQGEQRPKRGQLCSEICSQQHIKCTLANATWVKFSATEAQQANCPSCYHSFAVT